MSELKHIDLNLNWTTPEQKRKLLDELREAMGTQPQLRPQKQTRFFRGVEGIEVNYIDGPRNPYQSIFAITAATWGNVWQTKKWNRVSPEARFYVVLACLSGKSLPNGMESPSFTFEVAGLSRAAFDQIARIRIGAVIGSMGIRDNNHSDGDYRIPEAVYKDRHQLEEMKQALRNAKDAYVAYLDDGQGNWQDARAVMPMSMLHRFSICFNYMALRGFMGKRLQACEQADTVATAWLIRERVMEHFPLLAAYLRPSCDLARRCTYHEDSTLSEAFGCLFRGCGRWPEASDEYATFNESCSDYETLKQQAGFTYFGGEAKLVPTSYDELSDVDKVLFSEEQD